MSNTAGSKPVQERCVYSNPQVFVTADLDQVDFLVTWKSILVGIYRPVIMIITCFSVCETQTEFVTHPLFQLLRSAGHHD